MVIEVGKCRSLWVEGERTNRLTEDEDTACWTTILRGLRETVLLLLQYGTCTKLRTRIRDRQMVKAEDSARLFDGFALLRCLDGRFANCASSKVG
jgi:ABC-type arginine transport system permease subunit